MPNSEFLVRKWEKYLSEEVNPESVDLAALETKDSLNSDVWEDEDFIKSGIKHNIERIARDFIESLGIDVRIDDIVVTGSLANYNWSRFSDVDVHILVDFDEIDENHELVRELFTKAHAEWNRAHNIKVNDHEVEIYVQDIDEPHSSTGIYSILNDKWVKRPNKHQFTLNRDEIQAKTAHLMDEIDEIEVLIDNGDFKQAHNDASRMKEKIRNFRKGGLEKGGEYSSENLSFKILRRNGYLDKLSDIKNESYDKMMTLEERMAGVSNEPYQKMARRRFAKAMRLTIKGPNKYGIGRHGVKRSSAVPGKSGPPGE
jgi:predicted nucleotidyltransferase